MEFTARLLTLSRLCYIAMFATFIGQLINAFSQNSTTGIVLAIIQIVLGVPMLAWASASALGAVKEAVDDETQQMEEQMKKMEKQIADLKKEVKRLKAMD